MIKKNKGMEHSFPDFQYIYQMSKIKTFVMKRHTLKCGNVDNVWPADVHSPANSVAIQFEKVIATR